MFRYPFGLCTEQLDRTFSSFKIKFLLDIIKSLVEFDSGVSMSRLIRFSCV